MRIALTAFLKFEKTKDPNQRKAIHQLFNFHLLYFKELKMRLSDG